MDLLFCARIIMMKKVLFALVALFCYSHGTFAVELEQKNIVSAVTSLVVAGQKAHMSNDEIVSMIAKDQALTNFSPKTKRIIVTTLIALGVVSAVVAGYYGYNAYINSQPSVPTADVALQTVSPSAISNPRNVIAPNFVPRRSHRRCRPARPYSPSIE
jgi:hypothetical protein